MQALLRWKLLALRQFKWWWWREKVNWWLSIQRTITVVALCEMMTPILLKNAAKDDLVLCFGKTKRGSALALMKTHEVYKVIYVYQCVAQTQITCRERKFLNGAIRCINGKRRHPISMHNGEKKNQFKVLLAFNSIKCKTLPTLLHAFPSLSIKVEY